MFAIAAPSFNAPSETFIRDHVRLIAPGRTVLICREGGEELFDCPVLSGISSWSPPRTLFDRVTNAARQRWSRYIDRSLFFDDHCRVVDFLRSNRVEVLLAEFLNTGVQYIRACREADVRLFVHAHGYDVNILAEDWSWRRAYRRLFRTNATIIAGSQFLRRKIIDLGAAPSQVIYSPLGVNLCREMQPPCPAEPLILCVSRLILQKGVDLSIRSFSRILLKYPNARLEIVGDGPCRSQLEKLVADLGIGGSVIFFGSRPHEFVLERLGRASALVQHCITLPGQGIESFGLSVVEAMGAGLPVVVTKHGAFAELIADGQTGFLVGEGDIEAMTDRVVGLLADPIRARAIGDAARKYVLAHFTQRHASERLRSVLGLT
ncbi:glycosyltransferase [Labrys monachus]|uniref:glycosyltransferase n=1 Tax=Labrys monachus TaxID=217067 RepID=UPI003522843C